MSVDIVVIRIPGNKQGPDIVDPLLTNTTIAISRGEAEIQDNEPIDSIALTTNYRTGVKMGDIVEVLDSLQGKVWKGKVVGISHNNALADSWTDLDIERPRGL